MYIHQWQCGAIRDADDIEEDVAFVFFIAPKAIWRWSIQLYSITVTITD